MPRVLLTGGHSLVRNAFKALLSTAGFPVIGECSNDGEAIGAAVRASRPAVIVMDYDLGPATSSEMLSALLRAANGCPVLVVTAQEHRRAVTCALQHGVLGVISKKRSAEALVRAVRAVASGETWLERSVLQHMVQGDVEQPMKTTYEQLTRREAEIAHLVSLGLKNKKIAERLCISETTVRHHLTSVYEKLAVTNRLELMHYTYHQGGVAAVS